MVSPSSAFVTLIQNANLEKLINTYMLYFLYKPIACYGSIVNTRSRAHSTCIRVFADLFFLPPYSVFPSAMAFKPICSYIGTPAHYGPWPTCEGIAVRFPNFRR
jgi:hypothetical protein